MKNWLWAAPLAVATTVANADMILSGMYDGPLTGGLPKGFEVYITADIEDLSIYGLGSANNGGGTDGEEFTFSGSATAGSYYYVTDDIDGFVAFFGFTPDFIFDDSAASINGDDAIELFKNGEVIDVFGDINVDGTGEPWEHLDGWAYRIDNSAPNLGVFDITEWSFSGPNAWDDELDNITAQSPMPIGTFVTDFTTIDDGPIDPPPPSVEIGACFDEATLISTLQGSGTEVTITGDLVVEAIITGFNEDGYFIQEEAADSDGDPATSEGIYVFGTPLETVTVGSLVRVLGEATEFFDMSEIVQSEALDCGPSGETPVPVAIPMPYEGILDLETIEGMLATVTDAVAFSMDEFTRFGEIQLSDGLKWTPSDVAAPLTPEYEAAVANIGANVLLIDDNTGASFPDTISYYSTPEFDGLNYGNAPRVGDLVTATGPVNYSFDNYRILPTKDTFAITSNRPAAIEVSQGDVSVAAFNVLNYFNGLVLDDGTITFDYDDNRGAENEEEFALQQARIVDALVQLDADVVGLVEIENDGFGSDSAIRQLVVELNTALGSRVYRYARSRDASVTGTDAISNAIIYKRDVVTGVGPMVGIALPTQDKLDGDTVAMRNALVQRFRHLETGDTFAVTVNHFKSKGSTCFEDDNAPSELDDIQGSCNALRVSAAVALGEALEEMQLPEKVLIVGDLNSYSQEDPIAVLTNYSPEERGYTITTAVNTELDGGESVEVTETFGYIPVKDTFDPEGFSYYFFSDDQVGSLDHVLASPAAMDAVVDLAHWNINAREIFSLQYDQALAFYNPANGDLIDFTAVGPYRSSDHDPVVVTLTMTPRNWWINR